MKIKAIPLLVLLLSIAAYIATASADSSTGGVGWCNPDAVTCSDFTDWCPTSCCSVTGPEPVGSDCPSDTQAFCNCCCDTTSDLPDPFFNWNSFGYFNERLYPLVGHQAIVAGALINDPIYRVYLFLPINITLAIYYRSNNDTTLQADWTDWTPIPSDTSEVESLSAIIYDGLLYLAWAPASSYGMMWMTYDGIKWSDIHTSKLGDSAAAPTLCIFPSTNTLSVIYPYQNTTDSSMNQFQLRWSNFTDKNWTDSAFLPQEGQKVDMSTMSQVSCANNSDVLLVAFPQNDTKCHNPNYAAGGWPGITFTSNNLSSDVCDTPAIIFYPLLNNPVASFLFYIDVAKNNLAYGYSQYPSSGYGGFPVFYNGSEITPVIYHGLSAVTMGDGGLAVFFTTYVNNTEVLGWIVGNARATF